MTTRQNARPCSDLDGVPTSLAGNATPRPPPDAVLTRLGAGEREALLLAQELLADLVLIDERDVHDEATRRGFATFGTLRIMEMAAQRDLLDLPTALTHLAATTFYMDDALVQDLLTRDAARRRQEP